ncbi:Isochorismatase hydrolase [Pleomassaria siparia CBS 279.74]|uniref:Isochorismatase hydrolase n=1 Tax=Pleomassaria siparia CBS 279.74 TaxID=1314801 RepID=A0A6G1KQ33_9PLEO|nr:Isochorismatase hydrolase [Pleomassaria siparia CBS 279.74]
MASDPNNKDFLRLDPETSEQESTAKSFRQLLGIPPSTASPSDSVLIIIDAQNEYASGLLKVTNAESSGPVIASLLERYRVASGKIVHVLHKTPDGAPVFTQGSGLEESFLSLKPKESENEVVIWKAKPSSFADTHLDETLQKWGIKKLVLVGYMAHVCVSTTTRAAHERDYDVLIVEDGVGDRDIPGAKGNDVTTMVLKELADLFGTVVKSEDIK